MYYYRLTEGLSDKGKLIPAEKDLTSIYKIIKPNKDYYLSAFKFNEDHKKKFDETGSVAGIVNVVTDDLFFDIDSSDLHQAKKDLLELINRLNKKGYDSTCLKIFFSGNKGFELRITTDTEMTPSEVKNICLNIATGLKTIDPVIYNATRIIRLPLTKHNKSGLYKYPLTVDDVKSSSIEDIKQMAKQNLAYEDIKDVWTTAKLTKELKDLKNTTPKIDKEEIKSNTSTDLLLAISSLDFDNKPKGMSNSVFLISRGLFENGSRHECLLAYALYLKSKDLSDDEIHLECKKAARLQSIRTGSPDFPKKEIWQIVTSLKNHRGGLLTSNNSEVLRKLESLLPENSTSLVYRDLKTSEEIASSVRSFILNIDKNRVKTGIKELDDALDMLVGRLYIFAGSPGSGKSSILIQIFSALSQMGTKTMYFSFDMTLNDNFQKMVQKEFNLTAKQYFEEAKDENRFNEFVKKINEVYSNVVFVDSAGMSIAEMKNRIKAYEALQGEVKVIAVDYMALVQSDKSDSNEHSKAVAQGLKMIATEMNKCVISLNQPNKANQKINEPLSGYGGIAGSAEIQNLANAIMWIYRPGASPETFRNDNYYTIDCLKNRHGSMFSIDLHWTGVTGTVRTMTPVEKMNLQQFREEVKESKKNGDKDIF